MAEPIHRYFHYDVDTGKSTPVEPVKFKDGREVLVPKGTTQQIKKEVYSIPNTVSDESANSAIENWENQED
ncbi:MAG TPA: hypothetical protein VIQ31_26445 [Phormidium sp.]